MLKLSTIFHTQERSSTKLPAANKKVIKCPWKALVSGKCTCLLYFKYSNFFQAGQQIDKRLFNKFNAVDSSDCSSSRTLEGKKQEILSRRGETLDVISARGKEQETTCLVSDQPACSQPKAKN